jgi:hypothetical protein
LDLSAPVGSVPFEYLDLRNEKKEIGSNRPEDRIPWEVIIRCGNAVIATRSIIGETLVVVDAGVLGRQIFAYGSVVAAT